MTTQTELFPKTTMEVLESLRTFHMEDRDKALTALDSLGDDEKVARRYEKAKERLAAARDLVRDIDRAIAELRGMEPTVEDAIRDMKRTAEESGTRVTLSTGGESVTFGGKPVDPVIRLAPTVDHITGEVDDATGEVRTIYPGEKHAHITDVGSRTQYGELVADYLSTLPAASSHRDDPMGSYRVIGVEDEIDRGLRSPVSPDDYGVELAVVAREQGSVTGAPVEKVAS